MGCTSSSSSAAPGGPGSGGKAPGQPQELVETVRMFHGTTLSKAASIRQQGFIPSAAGELGPGVYLVDERDEDKARRFAHDELHRAQIPAGRDGPALVECELRIKKSRVFRSNRSNTRWSRARYDACYSSRTTRSRRPEWCVARTEQLRVVAVYDLSGTGCPFAPFPCPYEAKNPAMQGSPWGGTCPCAGGRGAPGAAATAAEDAPLLGGELEGGALVRKIEEAIAQYPLPPHWKAVTPSSPDGAVYYWNCVTNATSWSHPLDGCAEALLEAAQDCAAARAAASGAKASSLACQQRLELWMRRWHDAAVRELACWRTVEAAQDTPAYFFRLPSAEVASAAAVSDVQWENPWLALEHQLGFQVKALAWLLFLPMPSAPTRQVLKDTIPAVISVSSDGVPAHVESSIRGARANRDASLRL